MWQDKLKEIIYILENSNVNEIELKFWGRHYRVVKNATNNIIENQKIPLSSHIDTKSEKNNLDELDKKNDSTQSENVENIGKDILSPMPGTFYAAPTPDDPKFVAIGDKVQKGQTLCIIEAMKIMNEIESEIDGVIQDIKIENGNPVEYNQALFTIKSS